MTQEKIIDKIVKLKKMADGAAALGSEEEAQAFAMKMQQMLLDHKLDMTDIEFDTLDKEEPVGRHEIAYDEYPDVKLGRSRIAWSEKLASTVARAHFCQIIVWSGSSRISLVGRKSDAKCAEFMYITLRRIAEQLATTATREHQGLLWRTKRSCEGTGAFKQSFLDGFITRLYERYEAERRAAVGTSTALVLVAQEMKKVADFIAAAQKSKDLGKATKLVRKRPTSREGWERGRATADKVRLRSNAVEEGAPTPKRYLS